MIDSEQHPYVEWIAREARRPVVVDPAARDRLLAAVRAEPQPRAVPLVRLWKRVAEPRAIRVSLGGSALLAAGLVGIGVIAGLFANDRHGRSSVGQPRVVAVPQLPVSDTLVPFVYVAPQAQHVSVVGDFNEWDSTKTPMVRTPNSGVWTVKLPLTAGRHVYAYVVDGTWLADPAAPLAPDDGFGSTNSVKLVRRGTAL